VTAQPEERLVDVEVTATCRAWLDETWHVTVPQWVLDEYRAAGPEGDLETVVQWAMTHQPHSVTVEEESHDETDREWTGLRESPPVQQLALTEPIEFRRITGHGKEDPL
jgi:hypothetical protein